MPNELNVTKLCNLLKQKDLRGWCEMTSDVCLEYFKTGDMEIEFRHPKGQSRIVKNLVSCLRESVSMAKQWRPLHAIVLPRKVMVKKEEKPPNPVISSDERCKKAGERGSEAFANCKAIVDRCASMPQGPIEIVTSVGSFKAAVKDKCFALAASLSRMGFRLKEVKSISFNPSPQKSVTEVKRDAAPQQATSGGCISKDEMKLYELIMAYRREKGLPRIPLSKSLSYVARVHAKDVNDNPPAEDCNLHSWSRRGPWSSCCYTGDHREAACMWIKPRQLTNYKGNGYEISHGGGGGYVATPEDAMVGWKSSSGHNSVVINGGKWADKKWDAIGVGMYGGYSMVWFGVEPDPDGAPPQCR